MSDPNRQSTIADEGGRRVVEMRAHTDGTVTVRFGSTFTLSRLDAADAEHLATDLRDVAEIASAYEAESRRR